MRPLGDETKTEELNCGWDSNLVECVVCHFETPDERDSLDLALDYLLDFGIEFPIVNLCILLGLPQANGDRFFSGVTRSISSTGY